MQQRKYGHGHIIPYACVRVRVWVCSHLLRIAVLRGALLRGALLCSLCFACCALLCCDLMCFALLVLLCFALPVLRCWLCLAPFALFFYDIDRIKAARQRVYICIYDIYIYIYIYIACMRACVRRRYVHLYAHTNIQHVCDSFCSLANLEHSAYYSPWLPTKWMNVQWALRGAV